MPTDLAPAHKCVILDACCVIALYASGQMASILGSITQSVAVATYVRDVEARRILGRSSGGVTMPDEPIDLQPLIDGGLLVVASLESDEENNTAIDFAADIKDNGEAITGAIAVHRNWAIGCDDRDATKYFARVAPHLQLTTTPEMIKHWVEDAYPQPEIIRQALRDVRERARYVPGPRHPLHSWWQAHEA